MKNGIFPIICVILSVVITAFLLVGVKNYQKDIGEEKQKFSTFEKNIKEQESRKKEAEKIIFQLTETLNNVEKKSTVSIIFCGMSEDIYNLAFPVLKNYGITGTIVMTGNRLPRGQGLLNDEQILELYNSGWKLIPGWTAGDGDNGIASSAKWIKDYGYSFEGAVHVNSADMTDEIKAMLAAEGYNTIINDVGLGAIDSISTAEAGDVWNINAMGYNGNGAKGVLNEAIKIYGNLIFTVGFEQDEELYNEETLSSMIEYLKNCETNGYLYIGTVSETRNYRSQMDQRIKEAEDIISSDMIENEKIIEEADAAMKELYNTYME